MYLQMYYFFKEISILSLKHFANSFYCSAVIYAKPAVQFQNKPVSFCGEKVKTRSGFQEVDK